MEIPKGALLMVKALGIKIPDDVATEVEKVIADTPEIIRQLMQSLQNTERAIVVANKKLDFILEKLGDGPGHKTI
jgi:hypothetical protein